MNLPGIGKEHISREKFWQQQESMEGTMIADARLQLLKSGQHAKSGTRVHLYHGAAELVCKIILFDNRVVLKPSEKGHSPASDGAGDGNESKGIIYKILFAG